MTLSVVVGGQYGSEAKGAVAGYLARNLPNLLAVRVAGPNAGHSVINPATGTKHALRQVPVAAVTNPDATLYIAAGSEVDLDVLAAEIDSLEADGVNARSRLLVDVAATVITEEDYETESREALTERIGSTGKGVGSARARRIMRTAKTIRDHSHAGALRDYDLWTVSGIHDIGTRRFEHIQIEGTQGYGLGLHNDSCYPQVTSSDCRAIDFLSMAGLSPWGLDHAIEVWVVYRPYPIRVAGNSGYLLGETTWEELGLEPEYTTVTKKMRRVGRWDPTLARHALVANGGPSPFVKVALTMADQLDPYMAGYTGTNILEKSTSIYEFVRQVEKDLSSRIQLLGTSPSTIVDLR